MHAIMKNACPLWMLVQYQKMITVHYLLSVRYCWLVNSRQVVFRGREKREEVVMRYLWHFWCHVTPANTRTRPSSHRISGWWPLLLALSICPSWVRCLYFCDCCNYYLSAFLSPYLQWHRLNNKCCHYSGVKATCDVCDCFCSYNMFCTPGAELYMLHTWKMTKHDWLQL